MCLHVCVTASSSQHAAAVVVLSSHHLLHTHIHTHHTPSASKTHHQDTCMHSRVHTFRHHCALFDMALYLFGLKAGCLLSLIYLGQTPQRAWEGLIIKLACCCCDGIFMGDYFHPQTFLLFTEVCVCACLPHLCDFSLPPQCKVTALQIFRSVWDTTHKMSWKACRVKDGHRQK